MIKVLAPIDGSQQSLEALARGMELLRGAEFEVILLVVMQDGFDQAPEDILQAFDEDEDDQIIPSTSAADRVLDAAAARCGGVSVQRLCLEGRPREVILEQAENADVLLMCALQKSNLRDRLHMSSGEYLVRRAPCAVLLVQP